MGEEDIREEIEDIPIDSIQQQSSFSEQELSDQVQGKEEIESSVEHKQSEVTQKEETVPLPSGWVELVDNASGLPYYYNEESHKTTWSRPLEGEEIVMKEVEAKDIIAKVKDEFVPIDSNQEHSL